MTTLDPADIEFGLDTFGDIPRKEDGTLFTHAEAIRATLHEAVLADEIGVDTFTVGEHHRPDYAISSPTDDAGWHRHRNEAHEVGFGRDCLVLGRSSPRISAVCHP